MFLCDEVSGADHMLHLVGHKHALELLGDPGGTMGHVEIAHYQNELTEISGHGKIYIFTDIYFIY